MDRPDRGRFAGAVAALVVIGGVVPLGATAASRARFGSANPLHGVAPPWRWLGDDPSSALGDPIADDTLLDALIRVSLCVVWLAVVVIVVTTAIEVAHQLRHRGLPMPAIRGLGPVQHVARFIAVGLLAVLPAVTAAPSIAAPVATESALADVGPGDSPAAPSSARGSPSTPPTTHPEAPMPTMAAHVVRPGESVYSIALALAGGDRDAALGIADAIVDANLGSAVGRGQRFTNPAYVEAGWVLQVPASPVARTTTYEVQRGDTLWDIADEQLGDPLQWRAIWDRNSGADMGGGRTFDDPDLILPGWNLDLTEPAAPDVATGDGGATGPPAPDVATDVVAPEEPLPVSDASEWADPLPLTPTTVGSVPTTSMPTTTTSTTVPVAEPADRADAGAASTEAPEAPSPVRLEHAALLAAGILALVGVRRRRRLRAALPRHRVPDPRPEVMATERRLRAIDAGERTLRADVGCRAAASALVGSGAQIGWVRISADGDVMLRLTAGATLPPPWTGDGQEWTLPHDVPIELVGDAARRVGLACVALVQIGVTPEGDDVLIDVEACGVVAVEAQARQADEVVTALAAGLASSMYAEVAHLIGVGLPNAALLGHRNAHVADSIGEACDLAAALVGTTASAERTTFELRSLRTGGEIWEPAVVLATAATDLHDLVVPSPGHGIGVVVGVPAGALPGIGVRLVAEVDGWSLRGFGTVLDVTPIGLTRADLAAVDEILADAHQPLDAAEPMECDDVKPLTVIQPTEVPEVDEAEEEAGEEFSAREHRIVVGLLGGVEVWDREGTPGRFERSKTVELIAWLATHRERSTRTGARTALWELDVRDATFANVVSEARRALARLTPPPEGEEWVGRTLTEQLPLHEAVVTDADLVEERVAAARVQPPSLALDTLRPAVASIRDTPFAGTSYLWPDAEGITSNLVLLAITAATEYAGHALSLGDTDGVFWATGQGLRVLPGHEELIGLRMRAHARAGDLAGVRQEWESYERVLVADAWSDGEPAPKLLALRRELLAT
jgi:two-component SAPR family response regulator